MVSEELILGETSVLKTKDDIYNIPWLIGELVIFLSFKRPK